METQAPKTGIELIAAERQRQITEKGWTPEHDDTHTEQELPRAAAGYLNHYIARSWLIEDDLRLGGTLEQYQEEEPREPWPDEWADAWKPKGKIEDLTRIGALIAAEIDRLQRAKATTKEAA